MIVPKPRTWPHLVDDDADEAAVLLHLREVGAEDPLPARGGTGGGGIGRETAAPAPA